jgi:YHS domain-containing protein
MKTLKITIVLTFVAALLTLAMTSRADDQNSEKPKPYPFDTCLVCGMKFGDMGQPYAFVYKGQEIKVCDKSEAADFDKDPDKYLKKLADEEAKLKK